MHGLKIGHTTRNDVGTGVSVFLFGPNTHGAYWIAGSAPATHEIVVLDPDNSVTHVNALVLSGGSAYGLFSALGVMHYLTEHHIGHKTPHGIVPIVPAAAIYDLNYLAAQPPTADDAYAACLNATETNTDTGRIGAGHGATVGKLIGTATPMTGGIGRAAITFTNGLEVIAYAVVNSVGDVRDEHHQIIAGAKTPENQFADCEKFLISGEAHQSLFSHSNTTLAAIFTNARFNKSELKRIAKMAASGMARAISPIFTKYDGDIVFAFSLGEFFAEELMVGTAAAEAVRLAIINAVKASEKL